MAHPVSINLFDVLDAANSISGGSLPVSAALIGLVAVAALAIYCAERKQSRARLSRKAVAEIQARAQLDQWNSAGAEVLRRPPSELERVLAEHELAENLRKDALFPDVHDVFEDGDRD